MPLDVDNNGIDSDGPEPKEASGSSREADPSRFDLGEFANETMRLADTTLGANPELVPGDTESMEVDATIEELAEDMVHVLMAIRDLSQKHAELTALVETSLLELQRASRQQASELNVLHRDLVGDRRAQANRAAFNAIHPAIDQIRLIHDALGTDQDEAKLQISAVLSLLRMVLQGLDYVEFVVEANDPFDPATMECVEYREGELGKVLDVVRPGYRANGVVVRPCGVRIADPATARKPAAGTTHRQTERKNPKTEREAR